MAVPWIRAMPASSPTKKRSARRCLFGRPDAKSTADYLKTELDKLKKEQQQKWGFDFDLLLPLPGTSDSSFEYMALDAGSVPEYYRSKTFFSADKRVNNENKSPDASPEASDISLMDCSDSELRSPKTKSPSKKRRTSERRITDLFPIKRKHLQHSPKGLEQVSSPRREVVAQAV